MASNRNSRKQRRSSTAKGRKVSKQNGMGLGPVAEACAHIVDELLTKEDAFSFSQPVFKLWNKEELPDYLDIVKKPMDLGTIMTKIRTVKYTIEDGQSFRFDHNAFADDVRLVFENCKAYNPSGTEFYRLANSFLKHFEKKYKEIDFEALSKPEEDEDTEPKSGTDDAEMEIDSKVTPSKRKESRPNAEVSKKRKSAANGISVTSASAEINEAVTIADTSGISSDNDDAQDDEDEFEFVFVSTDGMEKRRGRKSQYIMSLERKHRMLVGQRKGIKDSIAELERRKGIPVSFEEKAKMCEDVANLDFVRMRSVVDIIVKGIKRPQILQEEEVELDIDELDRRTFRDVQLFLENPPAMTTHGTLKQIEGEIASLESQLIAERYNKIGANTD